MVALVKHLLIVCVCPLHRASKNWQAALRLDPSRQTYELCGGAPGQPVWNFRVTPTKQHKRTCADESQPVCAENLTFESRCHAQNGGYVDSEITEGKCSTNEVDAEKPVVLIFTISHYFMVVPETSVLDSMMAPCFACAICTGPILIITIIIIIAIIISIIIAIVVITIIVITIIVIGVTATTRRVQKPCQNR